MPGLPSLIARYLPIAIIIASCSSGGSKEPSTLEGKWSGTSIAGTDTLDFWIRIERDTSGLTAWFNSDQQRALDIPLREVKVDSASDQVSFALVGDQDAFLFAGHHSGDTLIGTVSKGERQASFRLVRTLEGPVPYSMEEVTFTNGPAVLSGTLRVPNGKARVAAMVFVHGSGSEPRFASAYLADLFARNGIATLIYDKRGVGRSTGNWLTADFQDLADDAYAGMHMLKQDPRIDSTRIGMFGHSQGGSICPLLLSRHPDVAFGISAASAGVSMLESDRYEVRNRMDRQLEKEDADRAMQVMEEVLHFASTGEGYAEMMDEVKRNEAEPWFKDAIGPIDSADAFFGYYRRIALYDPVEYWDDVHQPVLILKGEDDRTSPGYPSFQRIPDALQAGGNTRFKIILLPHTTHEMHLTASPDDFWFRATPGYTDSMLVWMKQQQIM